MAGRIQAQTEGINEINITPFVDVVLVLLILFMISTPALVYRGMRVALPKTATGEDLSRVTFRIYLNKAGEIHLDRRSVKLAELKQAILEVTGNNTQIDAVIFADKDISHGRVMELSEVMKVMGAKEIGFGTAKP